MTSFFAHDTAIVESSDIGDDTQIWAYSHVMKNSKIGHACSIADHCFVESGAIIGSYVTIKNGNMIWNGVTLEDGVFVGPAATFTNDLYPRSSRLPENQTDDGNVRPWLVETHVGKGAAIGASSVIIAGVKIGEFATIGAGATVTKDVHPYSLVIGTPARHHTWVCRCGLPLEFEAPKENETSKAECDFCKRAYEQTSETAIAML